MKKIEFLFVYFFLFIFTLHSEEKDLENCYQSVELTEGLPSNIVNDTVSVISGEYIDSCVDVVLLGPRPLMYARTYSNFISDGTLFRSWNDNHRNYIFTYDATFKKRKVNGLTLRLAHGSNYNYKKEKSAKSSPYELIVPKGLTNGSTELSGRTNIKNTKIHFINNDTLKAIEGNVHKKIFTKIAQNNPHFSKFILTSDCNSRNQSIIYNKDLTVVSKNEQTGLVYSFYNFTPHSNFKKHPVAYLNTSDNRKVAYKFQRYKYTVKSEQMAMTPAGMQKAKQKETFETYYLKEVEKSHAPSEKYEYAQRESDDLLQIAYKKLPNNRFLKTEYYKQNKNDLGGPIGVITLSKHDFRLDRVKKQMAPVGEDEKPVTIFRFDYQADIKKNNKVQEVIKGKTEVYDAYWHKTTYSYDRDHRLNKILKHDGTHGKGYSPYSIERFVWEKDNLVTKYLADAKCNCIHHGYNFSYDERGNTLSKSLFGKLTGFPTPPITLADNHVPHENGYERDSTHYSYSNDGLNLILSETNSSGKTNIYQYYPGTDLIQAKFIQYDGIIQLREFFYYDVEKNLVKKISDNGHSTDVNDISRASQRLITYFFPQNKMPYGLNEQIKEMYFDFSTGQEILLKRTENIFSNQGQLVKQTTFDANDNFAFFQYWEYDAHGNVTKEIDQNGDIIEKKYDENDNLILQVGPHPNFYVKNTYDFSNRLIKQEEFHSDGSCFVQTNRYNYLSQKISSTDHFGNETVYTYNDVGHLVSKQLPSVLTPSFEWICPSSQMDYDVAGAITKIKDGLGREIICENNIRGKPLVITYPDGNQEKMFYRLDGELVKRIEQNGNTVSYTLDPLGRRIKEELVGSDGKLIKCTQRTFNSLHLLSEESSDGTSIYYNYDCCGRLTRTYKNNILIQNLFYDSLSRVNRIHDYYDIENYRVTIKTYDILNRLLEEHIESSEGNLLHIQQFGYDCQGNKTLIQIGNQATHTTYNSYNKPTKIVDALGNTTYISYNFLAVNELGQRILEVITTDPLGNQIIQRYDALNRITQTSRKNSLNQLLSSQKNIYDLCGNCVCVVDDCIYENNIEKNIKTVSKFDNCNRLVKLIEAEGTSYQKCTEYYYNQIGQKITKIKPDGTNLFYAYDAVGRLNEFSSSDFSIHYTYEYNNSNQLICVNDLVKNTSNHRTYNLFGQLVEEILDNGLAIKLYSDLFDRVTEIDLPDNTKVKYLYDAANLKEVHRIVDNQTMYSQFNTDHTNSGLIKQEIRPGKIGIQTYEYDKLDRISAIQSPLFQQTIPVNGFDSVGNLKEYETNGTVSTFKYDDLYQIVSEDSCVNQCYTYDSLSNRRSKDNNNYEINQLNQLLSTENKSLIYDLNGNLIESRSPNKITFYIYDALDRLIESNIDGIKTIYEYDSFNRRISKKTDNNATIFYFYQDVEEIGSWQDDKIVELKILNQGNRKSVAIEINKVPYIPIQDLFGNVVKLFDLDGNLQTTYSYSVFGEIESEGMDNNPWLYSNRRRDNETGLFVYNLRYYDPSIGRWISPDPAAFEDGPNLYAHVHNNPLKYFDLMGLLSNEHDFSIASDMAHATQQTASMINFGMQTAWCGFKALNYGINSLFYNPDIIDQSGICAINSLKNPQTEKNFNYPISKERFIVMRNGIYNTKENFDQSLIHLGNISNHFVMGVFDNTRGLLSDCFNYGNRQYLNSCPTGERSLTNTLKYLCENFPNADILAVPHSRGCTDTRNSLMELPKEMQQRICVLAVAPGSFIDRDLCRDVIHLVSKGDPVPKIDFAGRLRCKDTIIELDSHPKSFKYFDHSFNSPTYLSSLTDYISNFVKNGKL